VDPPGDEVLAERLVLPVSRCRSRVHADERHRGRRHRRGQRSMSVQLIVETAQIPASHRDLLERPTQVPWIVADL
jgi:hypothetical protein